MAVSLKTPILKQVLTLLGVLVLLLVAFGLVILRTNSQIQLALKNPLERLSAVEKNTEKIPTLVTSMQTTEDRVLELQTKVQLYFDRSLDNKTAENVTGRAVNKVLETKNPIERRAALTVASDVLDRANAHHVSLNREKVSQFGLSLLGQPIDASDLGRFKDLMAKLAREWTSHSAFDKRSPRVLYLIDKEQKLDGMSFRDVIFVKSKILYDDGWMDLENVGFIDCTFDVSLRGGKEFYRGLFESQGLVPTVSLKSPGRPGPPKER
jgi:hypothetical protein